MLRAGQGIFVAAAAAAEDLSNGLAKVQTDLSYVRAEHGRLAAAVASAAGSTAVAAGAQADLGVLRAELGMHKVSLNEALRALRAAQQQLQQAEEGRKDETSMMMEELAELRGQLKVGAPGRPKGFSADDVATVKAIDQLRAQVTKMGEMQMRQTAELSVLRAVLLEVNAHIPLHTVRSTLFTLRSAERSQEERRLAIRALEAEEGHIKAKIEQLTQQSVSTLGSAPMVALGFSL